LCTNPFNERAAGITVHPFLGTCIEIYGKIEGKEEYYKMNPHPISEDPDLYSNGKLKRKIALITGRDSGIGTDTPFKRPHSPLNWQEPIFIGPAPILLT
jgi:hypothetical protein